MRYELLEDSKSNTTIPSDKSKEVVKNFKFFGWQPQPENIENFRENVQQYLEYPATRAASGALGGIGSLEKLLYEFPRAGVSALTGKENLPSYEQLQGKIPGLPLAPTSEQIHQSLETFAKEPIRAKTPVQEFIGDVADLLGSTAAFTGGKMLPAGRIPFTKHQLSKTATNIIQSVIPAAALNVMKESQVSPGTQAATMVGLNLVMHGFMGKSLNEMKSDLYKKVDELSENAMVPTDLLTKKLDKLESVLAKGGSTSVKSSILKKIHEIQAKTGGPTGVIPFDELKTFRENINELSKEFTGEQLKASKSYWKGLRSTIDETIDEYATKNPELVKTFRLANSLNKGIEESKVVESFLKSLPIPEGSMAKSVLIDKYLLPVIGIGATKTAPFIATAKGISYMRAMQNPGFRKAVYDVFKNASKRSIPGTKVALKELEKQAIKQELFDNKARENKNYRYELVD